MSPSITVAVNTLSVSDANEGTRTMLRHLLPTLGRVAPHLRQLLICSSFNRQLFDQDAEVVQVALNRRNVMARVAYDQFVVPRLARRRADVLLTPAGVGPLRPSLPHVMIVAAHLALPSCQRAAGDAGLSRSHRLYYGAPFRRSLRTADRVLGISQFVADGLVNELAIPTHTVGAMPLGVQPSAPTPAEHREPLVLFVGTLYGYKDAETAVRAFAAARPDLPSGARLVIVGRDPDNRRPGLLRVAEEAGIGSSVEIAGTVADRHLHDLYARASVLVMPSRCEGFGLPVAEAMSRGVPVVVADATSLPEVAGGAGIVVGVGDVGGFARAIVDVIVDPARHHLLAAAGLRRASDLSWDESARRLAAAIEAASPLRAEQVSL